VLTLQNGLEAERVALRWFRSVFGAVLWLPASYLRAGDVSAPGWPAVGVVWAGAVVGPAPPGAGGGGGQDDPAPSLGWQVQVALAEHDPPPTGAAPA
jgi:hypothetical protein